jgi:hypothetical protein
VKLPDLNVAENDRAALTEALGGRAMERFLLDVMRLPSCTMQAIDCVRVTDNAARNQHLLDDPAIDRVFANLESIFTALTDGSVDESYVASMARYAEEIRQLAPVAPAVMQGAAPLSGAVRLARVSVRVLPTEHQARYDEEWRAELHDLAAEGASWFGQLLYALRLLDRAWVLRAELKAAAATSRTRR